MDTDDNNHFELEKIQAELLQEQQMKEMLQQSISEMQLTVDEMEKRMDGLDDESNEWKTRYDTQCEMNQQLAKQCLVLQDKVEESRKTVKESRGSRSDRINRDGNEATPYFVKHLEKEKEMLAGQLRDLEWRLDQESKAYHKANEERKQFNVEITAARENIADMKQRQKYTHATGQPDLQINPTPRHAPTGNLNIAPDQRVLDPRKGPIRRTAAVKTLPRL